MPNLKHIINIIFSNTRTLVRTGLGLCAEPCLTNKGLHLSTSLNPNLNTKGTKQAGFMGFGAVLLAIMVLSVIASGSFILGIGAPRYFSDQSNKTQTSTNHLQSQAPEWPNNNNGQAGDSIQKLAEHSGVNSVNQDMQQVATSTEDTSVDAIALEDLKTQPQIEVMTAHDDFEHTFCFKLFKIPTHSCRIIIKLLGKFFEGDD